MRWTALEVTITFIWVTVLNDQILLSALSIKIIKVEKSYLQIEILSSRSFSFYLFCLVGHMMVYALMVEKYIQFSIKKTKQCNLCQARKWENIHQHIAFTAFSFRVNDP